MPEKRINLRREQKNSGFEIENDDFGDFAKVIRSNSLYDHIFFGCKGTILMSNRQKNILYLAVWGKK